jgi:hypothetical protein
VDRSNSGTKPNSVCNIQAAGAHQVEGIAGFHDASLEFAVDVYAMEDFEIAV